MDGLWGGNGRWEGERDFKILKHPCPFPFIPFIKPGLDRKVVC